ncbi:unnamed protein product [Ectocarpus sp. 8 AP-2014]
MVIGREAPVDKALRSAPALEDHPKMRKHQKPGTLLRQRARWRIIRRIKRVNYTSPVPCLSSSCSTWTKRCGPSTATRKPGGRTLGALATLASVTVKAPWNVPVPSGGKKSYDFSLAWSPYYAASNNRWASIGGTLNASNCLDVFCSLSVVLTRSFIDLHHSTLHQTNCVRWEFSVHIADRSPFPHHSRGQSASPWQVAHL